MDTQKKLEFKSLDEIFAKIVIEKHTVTERAHTIFKYLVH